MCLPLINILPFAGLPLVTISLKGLPLVAISLKGLPLVAIQYNNFAINILLCLQFSLIYFIFTANCIKNAFADNILYSKYLFSFVIYMNLYKSFLSKLKILSKLRSILCQ